MSQILLKLESLHRTQAIPARTAYPDQDVVRFLRRAGPACRLVVSVLGRLRDPSCQICILTEQGELLERRVRTEPGRFAEVLGPRPRARILIESATESEWVARLSTPRIGDRDTRSSPPVLTKHGASVPHA